MSHSTTTRHSYADRARHYRIHAAAARAAGDEVGARRLDAWAHRAACAHATHTTVDLDGIVAIAAQLEIQYGRALSIGESSAVKAAYQVACARDATYATMCAELARRHIDYDYDVGVGLSA